MYNQSDTGLGHLYPLIIHPRKGVYDVTHSSGVSACIGITRKSVAAASSQQPAANNQPPAASSQQPAASSQQPAASSQQPAASSQQPAASSQQPAASSQQPAASSQQPAASSQQPAASSQQPAASSQRPAASGQRPAASGQRPAASSQPPAISRQPPAASCQDERPDTSGAVRDDAEDGGGTSSQPQPTTLHGAQGPGAPVRMGGEQAALRRSHRDGRDPTRTDADRAATRASRPPAAAPPSAERANSHRAQTLPGGAPAARTDDRGADESRRAAASEEQRGPLQRDARARQTHTAADHTRTPRHRTHTHVNCAVAQQPRVRRTTCM